MKYPKDQILGFYLNEVPFGNNAYGVEAASQTYFGKSVQEVTLTEAAVLEALIQKPSYLGDLENNKEALLARKDYVLKRMYQEGFINKEEATKAQQEEINFRDISHPIRAPHFVLYLKERLIA